MEEIEKQYKKQIIEIKINNGFECKKCGSNEYHIKNEIVIICKKGHKETATVNTAFHGKKVPIFKAMAILYAVQDNYKNWFANQNGLPSNWGGYQEDEKEDIREKLSGATIARLSSEAVASKFEIQKKTAEDFINSIGLWVAENDSEDYEAYEEWIQGLKNAQSIKAYESLFHLLFYDDKPRSEEGVFYTLVTGIIDNEPEQY